MSKDIIEKQLKIVTKMRQEQLEDDLFNMSRMCIELQIALNEEKEHNEFLSKDEGGRNRLRIANEAITLRRNIRKKTNDLKAVIWKMNELQYKRIPPSDCI